MKVIQTRPAGVSDYNWLLKLHRDAYQSVITLQFGDWDEIEQLKFFHDIWNSKNITILMMDEKIIGMYKLDVYNNYHWLAELQIAAQYQNKGIGTQVIQTLILQAKSVSLPLRLRVLHMNHRALNLYQKLGFYCIGDTAYHHIMEIR